MPKKKKATWGGPRANAGGAREGAGRKPVGNVARVKLAITLTQETLDRLDAYAEAKGLTRSFAIEQLCLKRLKAFK